MSHYSYAAYAAHTLGLAFSADGLGPTVIKFKRSGPKFEPPLPPGDLNPEKPRTITQAFAFTFKIGAGDSANLSLEANAWAARPYFATTEFLLGNLVPFNRADLPPRGETPYSSRAAPKPGDANLEMTFSYSPTGSGPDGTRPGLTWENAASSGCLVLTEDNPGVLVTLRVPASTAVELIIGENNPWDAKEITLSIP